MRFTTKLYALAAIAAFSILSSAWWLKGYWHLTASPAAAEGQRFLHRLVVFGDSWSDGGFVRHASQGQVWPQKLCSQFSCLLNDMASSSSSSFAYNVGAYVDNNEIPPAETSGSTDLPLPDMKSQVSSWLTREKEAVRELTNEQVMDRKSNTIFTVFFGIWDIWRLLGQDTGPAKESIHRIVDSMFLQLKNLTESYSGESTKILLLTPIDVTLLPAFQANTTDHKHSMALYDEWNNRVTGHAEQWKQGSLFVVDTNSYLVDQIRERQLWVQGYTETADFGKDGMDWESVEEPCVSGRKKWLLWGDELCAAPEKFLFWDSMHLGSTGHSLLAADIFNAINELWLNPA